MSARAAPGVSPNQVLAEATAHASEFLGLTRAALSRIIGVSESSVSRVLRGDRAIDPNSKEGELSLLLVRVCRSLAPLVSADEQKCIAWMRSHNKALGGVPAHLIERADGLVATLNYLEGIRALARPA